MFILASCVIVVLWMTIKRVSLRAKVWRWKKLFNIKQHANTYQILRRNINGFSLSRKGRVDNDAMEYLYGEIEFVSFIALLSCVKPQKDTVFYDLGSGVGAAVFACAMVFDVKKCCGIELFPRLHQAALLQQKRLRNISGYAAKANRIQFIQGDFLTTNFFDATLIFINATAFIGATWVRLCKRLDHTSPGTTVISTSKPVASPAFRIVHTTRMMMSWGSVRIYLQKRQNEELICEKDNLDS